MEGGRIQVKPFPGAKSTQLNHYVTPTWKIIVMAIIHVGYNDMLRSKHHVELDKLSGNIIKVGNTRQMYNIRNIYISVILPSTRTDIIFDINKM